MNPTTTQLLELALIRRGYRDGEIGFGAIAVAQKLDDLAARDPESLPVTHMQDGGSTAELVLGFLRDPELTDEEVYQFFVLDNPSDRVLAALPA